MKQILSDNETDPKTDPKSAWSQGQGAFATTRGQTIIINSGPYEGLLGIILQTPDLARLLHPVVVQVPGVGTMELAQSQIAPQRTGA